MLLNVFISAIVVALALYQANFFAKKLALVGMTEFDIEESKREMGCKFSNNDEKLLEMVKEQRAWGLTLLVLMAQSSALIMIHQGVSYTLSFFG